MGLILVFDMDQTILDSSDPYLFNRPAGPEAHVILKEKIKEALNWNVVNIMKRAAALRPDGVSAICLLTNNSSEILVSAVDEVLQEEIGSTGKYKTYRNESAQSMPDKPYFFDAIMMREHFTRPRTVDNNPPKRLEDIQNILGMLNIQVNAADILKDIFFFDDIPTHELKTIFSQKDGGKYKNNYIHISPRYSKHTIDKTFYIPVLQALDRLDGKGLEITRAPAARPLLRVGRTSVSAPVSAYAPRKPETGRPRSNSMNNGDPTTNMNLPDLSQRSIRRNHVPIEFAPVSGKKTSVPRPSVFGAFSPNANKGGYRKTRKSLRRKRLTKKNIQKRR
jgi:hypothetical protein